MEGFTARFWEAVRRLRRLRRVLGIGSTYVHPDHSVAKAGAAAAGWGCGGKGLP